MVLSPHHLRLPNQLFNTQADSTQHNQTHAGQGEPTSMVRPACVRGCPPTPMSRRAFPSRRTAVASITTVTSIQSDYSLGVLSRSSVLLASRKQALEPHDPCRKLEQSARLEHQKFTRYEIGQISASPLDSPSLAGSPFRSVVKVDELVDDFPPGIFDVPFRSERWMTHSLPGL
jgi:hypothetical protein